MKLYLFSNFSKRKDSTKRPSLSDASATYEVYLKVTTDYDTPTFEIRDSSHQFPVFTYAYLEDIERYYFITSRKQRNAQTWEIVCELDELATFKATIQNMTAFVAYSSTDFNPLLNDPRVPKLNEVRVYKSSDYNTMFGNTNYDYLWVSGTNGTVCYRCNIKNVTQAIYNASNEDLLDNLCQTWADIQSCILYARSYSLDTQSDGSSEEVQIGKYGTGVNGARLTDGQLCKTYPTISIPIGGSYTDFRRLAFSSMKLSLPFVGVVELALADFIEDPTQTANVNIDFSMNLASGVLVYVIKNDEGSIIGKYNGVAGRARPVSLYSPYNGAGVLTSGGAALGGAAAVALATGPAGIVVGIGAAIAGLAGMVSASETTSGSTIGSNDGSCEEKINQSISLTVEEFASAIEPASLTAIAGRPCNKVRSLSGLTGYVQTVGASVSVNANSNVIDKLNTALDNGIYIE